MPKIVNDGSTEDMTERLFEQAIKRIASGIRSGKIKGNLTVKGLRGYGLRNKTNQTRAFNRIGDMGLIVKVGNRHKVSTIEMKQEMKA